MTSDTNEDRRVGIYFGPSSHTVLTKAEVGEFITDEMGLVRSDGGPKWTEGLVELIERGMQSWPEIEEDSLDIEQELVEIKDRLEEYQAETQELDTGQEQDHVDDMIDLAKRVYRTEARILEVLSRDENIGVKSPNYVNWTTVASETGLDLAIVMYYGLMMHSHEGPAFIELDRKQDNAKVTSEEMFELYCDQHQLDPDDIRSMNEVHSRAG